MLDPRVGASATENQPPSISESAFSLTLRADGLSDSPAISAKAIWSKFWAGQVRPVLSLELALECMFVFSTWCDIFTRVGLFAYVYVCIFVDVWYVVNHMHHNISIPGRTFASLPPKSITICCRQGGNRLHNLQVVMEDVSAASLSMHGWKKHIEISTSFKPVTKCIQILHLEIYLKRQITPQLCIYIYILYIHMYMYMYMYIYIYICIYIYTCIYVYIYIYLYMDLSEKMWKYCPHTPVGLSSFSALKLQSLAFRYPPPPIKKKQTHVSWLKHEIYVVWSSHILSPSGIPNTLGVMDIPIFVGDDHHVTWPWHT